VPFFSLSTVLASDVDCGGPRGPFCGRLGTYLAVTPVKDLGQVVARATQSRRLVLGFSLCLAALSACNSGVISDGSAPGTGGSAPGDPPPGAGSGGTSANGSAGSNGDPNAVGPRPLARLTRREYNNTVRDLLGDTTHPADGFADDRDRSFLFRRAGLVATQDADLLRDAAEALATTAKGSLTKLLPCDPTTGEEACAAKFISDFGMRAYRRPLSEPETTRLKALYANARGALKMTFNDAIEVMLEGVLQSPAFLYHWESPYVAPSLEGAAVHLSPYDVASRLSYFIWGSMPDQALFDAAGSGKLATEADIAAQARRMLADLKAKDAASSFFREWLELDDLSQLPKDAAAYPDYSDALKTSLLDETNAFVQSVLFDSGGRLETLLSADYSFSNQALSAVYKTGASGSALSKTPLDTSQRLGILTDPAFLVLTGSPDGSNPVKRGKAVYQKLLCGDLPPPPPNVPAAKPPSAGGTTRERFTEHDQNPCARGCHLLMDPLGYAFEHYDGIGRYRTTDNGQPVDSKSQVEIDGTVRQFADAVELSKILSVSATVRTCFAKQWFRFAFGRAETDADAPSLAAVATAFAANQYDMRELAPAIAASRSFRYRSLATGEVMP